MVRTRRPTCALLAVPLWLAAGCLDAPIESRPGENGSANGNGNGEPCTLSDPTLQPQQFEENVLPGLVQSCAISGACHDASGAQGGYAVFGGVYQSANIDENCDFVATLEAFIDFADRQDPGESRILRAIDGRHAHVGGPWQPDQSPRPEIEAYLEAIAGGGLEEALAAFESDIQPILDDTGGRSCAASAACHEAGAGGYTINPTPAPGSAEMRQNFDEAVARANPADPENSILVQRATVSHAGSPEVSPSERQALIDWIASLAN
jgi:hypothetical protein